MKKKYIAPAQQVLQLSLGTSILTASGPNGHIDVGMSDETANGSEALSSKRPDAWGTEDFWQ